MCIRDRCLQRSDVAVVRGRGRGGRRVSGPGLGGPAVAPVQHEDGPEEDDHDGKDQDFDHLCAAAQGREHRCLVRSHEPNGIAPTPDKRGYPGAATGVRVPDRRYAMKYLAWGCAQMMASVVCSGSSWEFSLIATPMLSLIHISP